MTQTDQDGNVVSFARPKSKEFCPKSTRGRLSIHAFIVSATLDGYVELALHAPDGSHNTTWQFTRDDARRVIAALNLTVQDITENCRFEDDARLYDEGSRP